jgi:hypothetical protein
MGNLSASLSPDDPAFAYISVACRDFVSVREGTIVRKQVRAHLSETPLTLMRRLFSNTNDIGNFVVHDVIIRIDDARSLFALSHLGIKNHDTIDFIRQPPLPPVPRFR